MTDNTPERPATTPAPPAPTPAPEAATQPAFPTAPPAFPPPAFPPPPFPPAVPQRRSRKRAFIACGVVAVLLVGGGVTWWALMDGDDPMSHVELSGGKLTEGENSLLEDDEVCDDADEFDYNNCDASKAYEFTYKITNKGEEPANYAVIVNGFDDDGDFVGQTFISATHLRPGTTDADTGDFDEYVELEDGHELSDIDSIEVAHVERVALAN
ncbi:hypothetical protein ACFV0T_20845 [Streptomyces sp. NPDC059582]|uniref:hypothetical protein n=1 Tax=Streptomyces sp. NPDC059582 TaxID=3346875 RepID=UPI00367AE085